MKNKHELDKKIVLKDKVVDFPLEGVEITLPSLIKKGFQRAEIMALFEELQAQGFGLYNKGTRGKSNYASFEFFIDLPGDTYRMTFSVQKLHGEYAGKPIDEKAAQKNELLYKINPESPGVKRQSLTASKYVVMLDDNKLTTYIADKGADTIEEALSLIWNQVKDKVNEPHYVNMTAKEAVASRLMGFGVYNLVQQ